MTRFIIIDNSSGKIFGDTAKGLASHQIYWTEKSEANIIDAVSLLHEEHAASICHYVYHRSAPITAIDGYYVYDASDKQGICTDDRQDEDAILKIESSCPYLGFVEVLIVE